MQLLLFQAFSIIVATALGILTSALWWRQLREPWLFLIAGTLVMLGLERLVTTLWAYGRIAFGSGFLERRPPLTAEQIANPTLSIESIAVSAIVLAIGLPLLFWLRRATGGA